MALCTKPRVVALLGITGCGKTAVVRRMVDAGFHRLRFADPARDMLAAGFGCNHHEIDGESRSRAQRRFGGNSVQFLMGSLIDDWGRYGVHSDIWNNEWRRRGEAIADAHPGETTYIVTDDLRRPSEAAAVRNVGGIIVRVTRPGYEPPSPHAAFKVAQIEADLELINQNPEALAIQTDAFIKGLIDQSSAEVA